MTGYPSQSRKSAYDLDKIKIWSHKWSQKPNGIRVRRIRTISFIPILLNGSIDYDPVKTRLLESEVELEEQTNQKTWNQAL